MKTHEWFNQKVRFGDSSPQACGYRVKLVRLALGFSQDRMADIMGLKVNAYQHIEKGANYPKPHYVKRLMDAEMVDHNFIFAGISSRLPSAIRTAIESSTE